MFFGTLTAMAHGISLPLLMLVFGELIDFFTYQFQSEVMANCLNVSRDCGAVFLSNVTNEISCSLFSGNNLTFVEFSGQTLSESVRSVFGDVSRCVTNDRFIDEVVLYSVYFVVIGFGVFCFGIIQISTFQLACERQVRKIRLAYYRAVLGQNIGWFDENPSGELASRLNE